MFTNAKTSWVMFLNEIIANRILFSEDTSLFIQVRMGPGIKYQLNSRQLALAFSLDLGFDLWKEFFKNCKNFLAIGTEATGCQTNSQGVSGLPDPFFLSNSQNALVNHWATDSNFGVLGVIFDFFP
ncbi:hypothetical protein SDC9_159121 [bioreactor metagenome]|uniref:Uncharacterized protein n=1 Tax=bioreactor metagenome TaxID=1076179 RepID=A0A645FHT6_9ZZZZ